MSKIIRDPIHGYIEVEEDELDVLDSKPVQRLRRVSQLGLSSIVYPGATHTRFLHSLGVMKLSERISQQLDLDEKKRKRNRMAALLHDTGHGPFSHASEMVAKKYGIEHENLSCNKIDEVEDSLPCNPEKVKNLIQGDGELNIISGQIDCDRMDYLKRDSHMSGLEHGDIDIDTIINSISIEDGEVAFEYKSAQSIAGFLTARSLMIMSLYGHKASRIAEKMLAYCLDKYSEEEGVHNMMEKDDYQIHTELMERPEGELYRRIVNRRKIYKTCGKIDLSNSSKENLREISSRLKAEDVKETMVDSLDELDNKDILVDMPTIPEDKDFREKIYRGGELHRIDKVIPLISNLKEEEWRATHFSVYGPEEKRDKINKVFIDNFHQFTV
jgi:HD superfamily phosphohydrolase